MDDPRLERLKQTMEARGWLWRPGKPIPYGTQLIVTDGSSEATLDFYPKRGRTVVGGATTPLRRALEVMVGAGSDHEGRERRSEARERDAANAETMTTASSEPPPSRLAPPDSGPGGQPPRPQLAELGMDESGKGDWFGPLVVAAVYVEPVNLPALRRAGVRDSKLIEAERLPEVAAAIEALVPPAARAVLALTPADYNSRYARLLNINLLLAELYAETALPVAQSTGTQTIVCDQFAQRTDRLELAFTRVGLPRPRQLHHAEATSLAVAAASVLATARFQAELVRLGAQAGLGRPLPRGASDIRLLTRAAHHILAREGPDGLGHYAKLNFKPVQEVLARHREP